MPVVDSFATPSRTLPLISNGGPVSFPVPGRVEAYASEAGAASWGPAGGDLQDSGPMCPLGWWGRVHGHRRGTYVVVKCVYVLGRRVSGQLAAHYAIRVRQWLDSAEFSAERESYLTFVVS